jgi:DNA invertase Pin-like site-specific DNA recombinase
MAEVVEVESGKKNDRPRLAEALRLCRLHGAVLIIAKVDRLARNIAFISNLMGSGVEFTAVDFPQANRLTVHILAAVAEHEREMISRRTKDALAAAKARGKKLGGNRGKVHLVAKKGGACQCCPPVGQGQSAGCGHQANRGGHPGARRHVPSPDCNGP